MKFHWIFGALRLFDQEESTVQPENYNNNKTCSKTRNCWSRRYSIVLISLPKKTTLYRFMNMFFKKYYINWYTWEDCTSWKSFEVPQFIGPISVVSGREAPFSPSPLDVFADWTVRLFFSHLSHRRPPIRYTSIIISNRTDLFFLAEPFVPNERKSYHFFSLGS